MEDGYYVGPVIGVAASAVALSVLMQLFLKVFSPCFPPRLVREPLPRIDRVRRHDAVARGDVLPLDAELLTDARERIAFDNGANARAIDDGLHLVIAVAKLQKFNTFLYSDKRCRGGRDEVQKLLVSIEEQRVPACVC